MNGYSPRDSVIWMEVGIVLAATLLAGLVLSRLPPRRSTRLLSWVLTLGATAAVERLCRDEPAGLRMLAIIGALLYGMKAVVTVEARADGMSALSPCQWLGFAALWPGMRPAPFAIAGGGRLPGALLLLGKGGMNSGVGLVLAVLAWITWHHGRPALSVETACVIATVLLMTGLSLIVHFGIFAMLTGLWRLAGVDVRPLFRAPLAARSLENFWSRRWNLAFTEMTAIGIYRPLSSSWGRKSATGAAFVASGVLHELAISLPVLAGFGWPLLYFVLHGALVLIERNVERKGPAVSGWGWRAHLWVLTWIALPAPLLFHQPFLRGVIWPLIDLN